MYVLLFGCIGKDIQRGGIRIIKRSLTRVHQNLTEHGSFRVMIDDMLVNSEMECWVMFPLILSYEIMAPLDVSTFPPSLYMAFRDTLYIPCI
ncbi:hypothetical protein TNCV_3259711 [Trichonephila clavipes]|nr:hypothetical protein TNCV_3259711 [Trichonephila clavipes]